MIKLQQPVPALTNLPYMEDLTPKCWGK